MQFLTRSECLQGWGHDGHTPDRIGGLACESIAFPVRAGRIRYLSHWMATSLTHQESSLLWITESGIWSSSENLHLYYRLRQSYGDQRLLEAAPGHLFLKHESEDLATFLQIAIQHAWGGYLLTQAQINVAISHDEFLEFYADDESHLSAIRETLKEK